MFHMFMPPHQAIVKAAELLNWRGAVVGPVAFGGVRFWAVATVLQCEHQRRVEAGEHAHTDRVDLERWLSTERQPAGPGSQPAIPIKLQGVVVPGERPRVVARKASYFAGYTRRAALVPDGIDTVEVATTAALLDLGLLVLTRNGVVKLSDSGARVGPTSFNAREWQLLELIYEAWRDAPASTAVVPVGA